MPKHKQLIHGGYPACGMMRKHFLLQVFFHTNARHGYYILKIKNHHVQIEIKNIF